MKGDATWEHGVFLGKVNETDEFLIGDESGVHSTRTARLLEEKKRWSLDAVMGFRGVPWDRGAAIGRPRKQPTLEGEAQPTTPATAAPSTPRPVQGSAGPKMPRVRGQAARNEGEPTMMKDAKKARISVTDSSAKLDEEDEPMMQFDKAAGSGMQEARDKRQNAIDEGDVEQAMKRWKKQEESVEAKFEGSPPKKLKVGEQTIGALFSAVEGPGEIESQMAEDELEIDEDYMAKAHHNNLTWEEEESQESLPITDAERAEGRQRELKKMDELKTYKVVPAAQAEGKRTLDPTWVEARKPDGSVRMRYCLREFKSSAYRDDVYAVSTSSSTGRLIDFIGVHKKQCFFTADATNALWQVPTDEECYMYPPREWLENEAAEGRSTGVMRMLEKEWYGRRVSGTKWVEWAVNIIQGVGCKRSELAPRLSSPTT